MDKIETTVSLIRGLNEAAMESAKERQRNLTKPEGSLGVLEDISVKIAGITGQLCPSFEKKAVVVMAGDHGVTVERVSAYPAEVTPQMVLNFANGGAAINVLARHADCDVIVVDVGVAAELPPLGSIVSRKVKAGTENIAKGPAMTIREAEEALSVGMAIVCDLASKGYGLVATGDMGIGNTTSSAAIVSTLTGATPELVVGRGTGVDDAALMNKVEVVKKAIAVNEPRMEEPVELLAKLGGLEIAAIAGAILAAASVRIPVIIDGYISAASALVAARIAPATTQYMIASHLSMEPGHKVALDLLGLRPMLDMNMRLGEGTGAVLAMHLIEAAVLILNEMVTFEEAGVASKE